MEEEEYQESLLADVDSWRNSGEADYKSFVERYAEGSCINCGFLAKTGLFRHHLQEARHAERLSGNLFFLEDGNPSAPECYVGEAELLHEYFAACDQSPYREDHDFLVGIGSTFVTTRPDVRVKMADTLLPLLKKDRGPCPQWTPWVQHRPPEWHLEHKRMSDLRKLDAAAARRAMTTNIIVGTVGAVMAAGQLLIGIAAYRFTTNDPKPTPVYVVTATPQPQPTLDTASPRPQ